ncbi:hypothetical protein HOLleu_10638 [Holothuria leucospilota]|uniref:Uncharacterized protein n=1 Tax=Holothuria leucospilota TaxID=206669 RepID=A0A9Q1CF43_HOLLE|nr:hypothetical protein HOLleu_10638 [Holothuria leucospilota]
MLWLMCLPLVKCLPGLQCTIIAFMPLLASICGPDLVLRLSLILMLHAVITGVVPFIKGIPFLSPALLVAMVALPINIAPSILVKAYSQLIWISEPFLMVMEAVAVVQVVMAISKMLVGYIEDNPLIVKSAVLGITFTSYASSFCLGGILWLSGGSDIRWILGIILLMSIMLAITTIMTDDGIISSCAMVSLYLTWCLWVMVQENKLATHPLKPPVTWQRATATHASIFQILYGLIHLQLESVKSSLLFMWNLLSPTTIVMVMIRSFIISRTGNVLQNLTAMLTERDEDGDLWDIDSDDESDKDRFVSNGACFSRGGGHSLPLKLSFLFVYTQLIVYNIENLVSPMTLRTFSMDFIKNMLYYGEVKTLRAFQIALSGLFYLWSLLRDGKEDDDVDW